MTKPGSSGRGNPIGRFARGVRSRRPGLEGTGGSGHDRPIFVLGCCHRTGSTLLQRLVSSMADVFVWGENHGQASKVLESRQELLRWSNLHAGVRDEIRQSSSHAFMANATPDAAHIDDAYRAFFRELYGSDVDGRPVGRWGYKEVRHDSAQLQQLLELFPRGRAIVINRHLGQVAESLLRWEFDPTIEWAPEWTMDALHTWRSNTLEMASLPSDLVLRLNYDDLVQSTEETLRRIEQHVGAPTGAIDRQVIRVRVHADGERGRSAVRATVTTIPAPVARFLNDDQTAAAIEALERYW